MANFMKLMTVVLASAWAAGCASIVSGGPEMVHIFSDEPQRFFIHDEDGRLVRKGETPYSVTLDTGHGYFDGATYTVSTPDGGSSAVIDSHLSAWYFGNFLFGGLLGLFVVDPFTGAMWYLTPDEVYLEGPPDDSIYLGDR